MRVPMLPSTASGMTAAATAVRQGAPISGTGGGHKYGPPLSMTSATTVT